MTESHVRQIMQQYHRWAIAFFASAPDAVRDEYVPRFDEAGLSAEVVAAIERDLPVALPPSFKQYLTGAAVDRGPEWSDVRVPGNTDADRIADRLRNDELWPLQLLEFTDGPSGDPVCFDFAEPAADGEWPVVIIRHDRASAADWEDPVRIRKFVSIRWPDFGSFLAEIAGRKELEFASFR